MKIEFTEKQYRLLLDLVFAGEMLVNGARKLEDAVKEYEELQQYIYSHAAKFGLKNLVEYDKEYKMYFETHEFEESPITGFLEEYEDDVFWDRLAYYLAKRDVETEFRGIKKVDPYEKKKRIMDLEEQYQKEFYKYGLGRLNVKESSLRCG